MVLCIFGVIKLVLNLLSTDPDPLRYQHQINAFVERDDNANISTNDVVFVGSSSIRRWQLGKSFPHISALNRGFGGSQLSDVDFFLEETVLRYKPRIVVIYAGENDIAASKSSDIVLEDFQVIVERILSNKENVKIIFIALKPSPAREKLWNKMQTTNKMIQNYTKQHRNLYFVDIASRMLSDSGELRPEFYASDGLHLSQSGYDVWTHALSEVLEPLYQKAIQSVESD